MQHSGCCQQIAAAPAATFIRRPCACVCVSVCKSHFGSAMRYARFGNFSDAAIRSLLLCRDIILLEK